MSYSKTYTVSTLLSERAYDHLQEAKSKLSKLTYDVETGLSTTEIQVRIMQASYEVQQAIHSIYESDNCASCQKDVTEYEVSFD